MQEVVFVIECRMEIEGRDGVGDVVVVVVVRRCRVVWVAGTNETPPF